jgi:hypothetical protein
MDYERALDKIRVELVNLSPDLFPVAVALDFQKKESGKNGDIDPSVRVPQAIQDLMKTVERHWSHFAEQAGITPLQFRENPVVKLDNV